MKYLVLVMLLSASPVLADSETLVQIPNDMSIMELGVIAPQDLGAVTASDLVATPAEPLPENMELPHDN